MPPKAIQFRTLVHLKERTNLKGRNLGIQVTGAGLEHLKRLTNLESLHLEGNQNDRPQDLPQKQSSRRRRDQAPAVERQ